MLLAAALALSMTPAAAFAEADLAAGTVAGGVLQPQATPDEAPALEAQASVPHVQYRTLVQSDGWQSWRKDGQEAGTHGRSLRLEALEMKLSGISGGIQYRAHVQNVGWQGWKSNGRLAGTSGKGLRMEAVQVRLTGDAAKRYDVYYRLHVQNIGWTGWARNGSSAGSAGYSYRVEAMQVRLVKKGGKAPGATSGAFRTPLVSYRTHVQRDGWQSWRADGAEAGTHGRSLRLEGLNVKLGPGVAGGIRYRTHVQTYGWQGWRSNGQMSGTSGESKRLEAVQIQLTGQAAKKYDVYYRVHAQHFGWMGWARNGERAGTAGYSYRLEALQVRLVKKGGKTPGPAAATFRQGGRTPEKKWVPEQGHYEDVYETVHVPAVTHEEPVYTTVVDQEAYTTYTRVYYTRDGWSGTDRDEARQHHISAGGHTWWEDIPEKHPAVTHQEQTGTTTVVDTPAHDERRKTGTRWVVDVPGHWE